MLKKVTNKIYCMPHNNDLGSPTLGLICGADCSLIVDAGNSPNHAKIFKEELYKLSNIPPVKYLVLTHHHSDHTSALNQWDDLITISCKKTKEKIQNIDIAFQDELVIELGGTICILKEIPSSHTADSTIIYIPKEKVMFLGDALYTTYSCGKFIYNRRKTLQMIESIEKYDTEYYIFSHDSLCDCNKYGMKEFFTTLKTIEQIVEKKDTINDIVTKFIEKYNRNPNSDEMFIIKCFIN